MERKKYELTGETIKYKGYTLHRIKALKDIVINTEITIKKGNLGGWIEKEYNLSQDGNCWVSGKAKVFGDATVKGCAYVSDYVEVHGNAIIRDNSKVYGYADVYGHSWIGDKSEIFGNAAVHGEAFVNGYAKVYGYADVYGHSWIGDKSEVYCDTKIYGNAQIYDETVICGKCCVYGNALVYGNAQIHGNALVCGDAKVYENAEVYGNAIIREHAEIHGTACLKEGTFQGTFNTSETNVLKETKHFTVEVFKINSDLSREKIMTIYINTDINDIDYLSFLIKQKHKLDNIPVSLKFTEEYNCYEDFMKQ